MAGGREGEEVLRLGPPLRPPHALRAAGAVPLALPRPEVPRRGRLHRPGGGAPRRVAEGRAASGTARCSCSLADHGESLGEHGENTHTFFVYDATQHVPLIVRTPWGDRGRSRAQVSTVDVMPTVLDLVGLAPQPEIDGRSLARLVLHPATRRAGGRLLRDLLPALPLRLAAPAVAARRPVEVHRGADARALRRAAGPRRDEERLQGLLAPRGGPAPAAREDGGQRRPGRARRGDARPRDPAEAGRARLRGRRPEGGPRGRAPRPQGQDRSLREDGRRSRPREGGEARGGGRSPCAR